VPAQHHRIVEVLLEGLLGRDGLRGVVGGHPARVLATREPLQLGALGLPDDPLQRPQVGVGQLPHRAVPVGGQALDGLRPRAPEVRHGQGTQAVPDLRSGPVQQAVRLGLGRQQLGHGLRRPHAHRAGEVELRPDVGADPVPDGAGVTEQPDGTCDVEEGLVEGQRLDQRRVGAQDGHHRPRSLAVALEVAADDHQFGAQAAGPHHRHRAVDPEASGLVRGSGDDPSASLAPHDHRPSLQRRIVPLLDGGVEGVHVDVQDRFGDLRPSRRHDPASPNARSPQGSSYWRLAGRRATSSETDRPRLRPGGSHLGVWTHPPSPANGDPPVQRVSRGPMRGAHAPHYAVTGDRPLVSGDGTPRPAERERVCRSLAAAAHIPAEVPCEVAHLLIPTRKRQLRSGLAAVVNAY
jgi:hypothetical protein